VIFFSNSVYTQWVGEYVIVLWKAESGVFLLNACVVVYVYVPAAVAAGVGGGGGRNHSSLLQHPQELIYDLQSLEVENEICIFIKLTEPLCTVSLFRFMPLCKMF
jgi:hypothetical protein